MNKKGVGVTFCLISEILVSTKYISVAMFMSNLATKDASLFKKGLEYVGPLLSIEAILAMIIGILFLGYGLYTDSKI
ncbi:hypothetical protein ACTQXK_09320 [Catenibacterium mitsuokai]|uniref:hypothetical protein n=1 Tax=Catenibacterium mitsuokai TaxID=100886 RepID=UPI003D03528E